MRTPWNKSILETTLLAVLVVAALVSAAFILVTLNITDRRAHESSTLRLSELIESAENTASIACFVEDYTLALETARGLLKNGDVLGVVIRTDKQELARAYRDRATLAAGSTPRPGRLVRPLYSPFNPKEKVGEIQLDADMEGIQHTIGEQVRFVGTLLVLLVIAVVVAVAGVVLLVVVRPVQAMSNRVHKMDATAGETLPVPAGHADTELGRLAKDINALAGRLVGTLQHEQQLRLAKELDERKYHAIFDNVEACIFVADSAGRLESINPAFDRLLREAADREPGDKLLLSDLPWVSTTRLGEMLSLCLRCNTPQADDLELRLSEDDCRWLHLVLRPIGNELVQGMATDVTERHLTEALACRLLITDRLTGTANRAGLEGALKERLAKENPEPFALMLIDLDGFQRVNDALGLPAGDEILKNAARRLTSSLEERDVLARMGADEFAVIASTPLGEEEAARTGERLVQVLNFTFIAEGMPVHLGASIGISLFPVDGNTAPSLLRCADLAQSRAQANGGGRFQFYDPSMAQVAEQRRQLDADMRLAIRRNEFRLNYQPIVDLKKNRPVGMEALLRWHRHDQGFVPPDVFIPVAEESGFIREVGLWVLDHACAQLARWAAQDLDHYVSINVSGRQIPEGLPPTLIAETVRRHGIAPNRLVLEITEGVLINDVAGAQSWINEVTDKGFRVFLDDFGTGYSSLSYLKRFAVGSVKVDKSFVGDMVEDSSDRKLVAAVVAMAGSLGLSTIAEGVESREQMDLLRALNCRFAQGYLFSRPVPAEEIPAAMARIAAELGQDSLSPA